MRTKTTTAASKYIAEKNHNPLRQSARILWLVALSIVALTSQATAGYAQSPITPSVVTPNSVTLANMSGTWVVSLVGITGCGQVAMRALADLNTSGQTTSASLVTHGQCGNATTTETFEINSLQSSGTGTAHLSCGEGCGWDFSIQVASGNNVFNLTDVTNGENYLAGTAIRKQ